LLFWVAVLALLFMFVVVVMISSGSISC
jgi:hypothetical protein